MFSFNKSSTCTDVLLGLPGPEISAESILYNMKARHDRFDLMYQINCC